MSSFRSTVFDFVNNSAVTDKRDFLLKDSKELEGVIELLKRSEPFKGKLKKDAWNYTVSINASEKINVYEDIDSNVLVKLMELSKKYSGSEIDYNCF